jgi:hypothetical protein
VTPEQRLQKSVKKSLQKPGISPKSPTDYATDPKKRRGTKMSNSGIQSAMVTLRQRVDDGESQVTVRISIHPSAAKVEPHFSGDDLEHPAVLRAGSECIKHFESEQKLLLACVLAVAIGIETFREQYPKQIDYKTTLMTGEGLRTDCTVGFAVAAFMAAVRATGFSPPIENDMAGWTEVPIGD